VVRDAEHVIAAGLFLCYKDLIHYHLAGSDDAYKKFAPNNFLLHTVALRGQKRGFRWLHLGGGRTSSSDDSLFCFKAGLSRIRLPFYIGKRVHNRAMYEELCTEWMRQKSLKECPSYFLLYRLDDVSNPVNPY